MFLFIFNTKQATFFLTFFIYLQRAQIFRKQLGEMSEGLIAEKRREKHQPVNILSREAQNEMTFSFQ